jgi:hypothetical protein
VGESDFPRRLAHFRRATQDVYEPEVAVMVETAAKRIAESLWLAMFGVFAGRPSWR